MIDYHIHTDISADCKVPMRRMAQAACDAGIKEVGFAQHIDLDLPGEVELDFSSINFEAYTAEILEIRREFPELTVRCGIEAGLDLATKDRISDILAGFACDFVIGSQHIVFGNDPFYESSWEGRTQREMYDEYMRVSLETVKACGFFDVLGHVGYIGKFCPYEDKLLRYSDYPDAVDALLRALVERGKGLEVNTNGLYMTPSTMPETAIVRRFFELGGEIVTIGSDAHYESVVGHAVTETLEMLKSIGFKYVCAFDNRQPRFIKLP